jgi:hypothetical protein
MTELESASAATATGFLSDDRNCTGAPSEAQINELVEWATVALGNESSIDFRLRCLRRAGRQSRLAPLFFPPVRSST